MNLVSCCHITFFFFFFFAAQWEWDSSPLKKASVVELDNENLMATRKSGGHNPAVMTVTPFTRNSWYFQVKIHQASKWLGIGEKTTIFQKYQRFIYFFFGFQD